MSFLNLTDFIAVAAKIKGQILIGYGETGGLILRYLNEGFNIKHIPMYRGSINPIKNIKPFFLSGNFLKRKSQI